MQKDEHDFAILLKDNQMKFFTVDQNVGINLRPKCILTKFGLSAFSHFQDIKVQI